MFVTDIGIENQKMCASMLWFTTNAWVGWKHVGIVLEATKEPSMPSSECPHTVEHAYHHVRECTFTNMLDRGVWAASYKHVFVNFFRLIAHPHTDIGLTHSCGKVVSY